MKFTQLIPKNISYYKRYYRLAGVAVLITVAVIVGSMMIGDSVRNTLVKRVAERLGDTETVVFSQTGFIDQSILQDSIFKDSAEGVLLSNGFISQNGKLIPVTVWGVNDSSIIKGYSMLSEALLEEFDDKKMPSIVLRLPSGGLVPSGSMFVTENYTTSMRLEYGGVKSSEEGGNLSLKNEQTLPLNIFVNRDELAQQLQVEGKINVILSNKKISSKDLNKAWDYSKSGLKISKYKDYYQLTSERVFLPKEVINTCSNSGKSNRLFSYLANSIKYKHDSIPYSFVTAIDSYNGMELADNEVILSDYSAKRLNAGINDTVDISYFTSGNFKTLQTHNKQLIVRAIVPISELQADSTLSANFPGLSDVDRCSEWDSDLPIDMDLIDKSDEDYWEVYKSTPKALLAYNSVASEWANEFGSATAIRTSNKPNLQSLNAEMFGIQTVQPKEQGIYAAKNGVDFSSLFLALGFFIIISAIVLMQIPLSEMLLKRKNEISTLRAIGFNNKRIIKMLWRESMPIVLQWSILGVVAGFAYTAIIIWLLSGAWKGATHTEGFALYPSVQNIIMGLLVSLIIALFVLRRTIRKSIMSKKINAKAKTVSFNRVKYLTVLSSFATLITVVYSMFSDKSITMFVVIGILMLTSFTMFMYWYLLSYAKRDFTSFKLDQLKWKSLISNKRQSMQAFVSLSIGVFIVFAVGLNRKSFNDSSQLVSGTGGYSIWAESSVPVYHNMNTVEGRKKLSLSDLPKDSKILQCNRLSVDEASCLNLNKVSTPTVLGVDMEQLFSSKMPILKNIYDNNKKSLLPKMKEGSNKIYPALIDETVLTWIVMKQLGDTIFYQSENGDSIGLQLVGTLPNTIFQGNVLVDKNVFSSIWTENTGSEVFLLDVEQDKLDETKDLLAQALNQYGVRVMTTNQRLKEFNSVTDTYLSIFLTLGCIGLVLGIMGFVIVIRKNLVSRQDEIKTYRVLGFSKSTISGVLYAENIIIPLFAIIAGLISALISATLSYTAISFSLAFTALFFASLFIVVLLVYVKQVVRKNLASY